MFILSENGWFDVSKLFYTEKPIVLHVDRKLTSPRLRGNLYIFIQIEPEAYLPMENYLLENYTLYDYILTFNETVLKGCPNAYKYIYGTTWISPLTWSSIDVSRKRFEVSSIVGAKDSTVGHRFRKNLYAGQDFLPRYIPYRFFRSVHSKLDLPAIGQQFYFSNSSQEAKEEAFLDSQFHIVIENSREANYFTEKLCDALLTKTIPIYYGCTNISEYFNTEGWIILESETVEEVAQKLFALTPEYYKKYTQIIENNYYLAMNYTDVYANLNKTLKLLPL
jgi:hypothetical protein